ncbi:enolase C-terminal domain-like protein [Blattabacterium cuenoti]|uniref:enolase C-terminal domain-like protein n=1 Tax=Blattabacterium cuenoti TaxID=1653831 RepID=UPI001EEB832D|nr:enolase C-terminal domain-like protein [Blattabacterium cuenoti]
MKIFIFKKKFIFKNKIYNSNKIFRYSIIWYIILKNNNKIGIGECNPILDKLALKNLKKFENELYIVSNKIIFNKMKIFYYYKYINYSSILFGLEQAFLSLKNKFIILYNSEFTKGWKGVPINDLIWLNAWKKHDIIKKIENKIFEGFLFIKIKINIKLIYYQCKILEYINKKYPFVKIRIDANGCFNNKNIALYYINNILYKFHIIHSIEQPILSGNWKEMYEICKKSKLPIALDEELEGIKKLEDKKKLLDFIKPNYIVIKPSVNGGFYESEEWIFEAKKRNIKWWISSSLESNIGINAIAQWSFMMNKKYKKIITHGLNTSFLYTKNFNIPIKIIKGHIWYNIPSIQSNKKNIIKSFFSNIKCG